MLGHKGVVGQFRVGVANAGKFLGLAGRKDLVGIKTVNRVNEPLPAQHLENARDATVESVGRVEESGIHVRHGHGALEPSGAELGLLGCRLGLAEKLHGRVSPHAPVAQQAADDAARDGFSPMREGERRKQVGDDGVVVAGVEREIVAAGVGDSADYIDRLVAVKRRQLDGDDPGISANFRQKA